jgi:1,2-diacylglycerol 3-alpha-glucosyltransferase
MADIFVSASKTENHPITLLEAMASKCAVVSLATPGFVDTVENRKEGILVKEEDPEKFAKEILEILKDKKKLDKMKKAAFIKSKNYNSEMAVSRMEKLYYRMIKENLKSQ